MARKPVHLQPAGAMTPRDVIWTALRKLKTCRMDKLIVTTHQSPNAIMSYLKSLRAAGFVQVERGLITLLRDVGIEAPRLRRDGSAVTQGRAREHMWRTMRVVREFTFRELAVQASTEEQTIHELDARDYVAHLHRAGYLAVVSPAKPGGKSRAGALARYRLLPSRNTGPKPPMVQRVKQVFDPNLGQVVWPKGGVR